MIQDGLFGPRTLLAIEYADSSDRMILLDILLEIRELREELAALTPDRGII